MSIWDFAWWVNFINVDLSLDAGIHGLDGKAHRGAWSAAESDMERGNVNVWQKGNRGTGAATDFRTDDSSNNYKDAAKADYETFWKRMAELKESGKINEKTYRIIMNTKEINGRRR